MSINIDIPKIKTLKPRYETFISTEGKQWQQERDEKDIFLGTHFFNKQALESLDDGTLREFIRKLWAYNGWTNKDYLLEEMLKSGLDVIIKSFIALLHSNRSVADRFDYAKKNVRMLGSTGISEIMSHYDKAKYPIWSRRVRDSLVYIGVSDELLPKATAQINGAQYSGFCATAKEVFNQVQKVIPQIDSLFSMDFLLYHISINEIGSNIDPVPVQVDFDHSTAIEQVLELGDGLGFDVEKEYSIAHGCRIDALWRTRIANLGTLSYAFEVHRRGSRDSAILNLQRVIRLDSSIQKVILVSNNEELEIFKREIASLSEDFRNAIGYFDINELQKALTNLEVLKTILKEIGLMNIERLL